MPTLKDKAAIAGIGATEFSKRSGRSEMQLAVEAISAAIDDAGLPITAIDGLATYTMDDNMETEIQRNLGIPELSFFSRSPFGGGGACGPFLQAAMAVATGVAEVVVCYRALNERSGVRFGAPMTASVVTGSSMLLQYHTSVGLQTVPAMIALAIQRYMHETGARAEDFATVSIAARKHAATNPHAYFYERPITLDDYMASRMIADPLRLLDCCQESDGGVAVVVTTPERARDLRRKAVMIRAAAVATPPGAYTPAFAQMMYDRADGLLFPEIEMVGRRLYAMAGLSPADMDMAIIYDHFGPSVLPALEALGFCRPGEAKDFVKNGAIEVGGLLPINTHGGQLGEAYLHGMNGVQEAVRQLRGTAVNQVVGVQHVMVTGASGNPGSGMILGAG